ncbi:MAG: apolipoprotein N-acyltransferase, partial [Polyangiaceae bacterium]|nr:apolipoprotein N-acyltransferase [Polyangiaceae bacterium]
GIMMVLLILYQGGRFSLLGWLYARSAARGWPPGLVFTFAFIASETIWPLVFPFTFGASFHHVYPVLQLAEIGGPILVALVGVATSWGFASWIIGYLSIPADQRTWWSLRSWAHAFQRAGRVRLGVLLGALPAVVTVYGLLRIAQVDEAVQKAEKLRVGLVQANLALDAKLFFSNDSLFTHQRLTQKIRNQGAQLAVWSETSMGGSYPEDTGPRYYERIVTSPLKMPAIVGAVLHRAVEDARSYLMFNTAFLADGQGKVTGRYDKHILIPFGEYLPFGDSFPSIYRYSPNSGRFSPGTRMKPLKFGAHEIAIFICYEDIMPELVNEIMNAGDAGLLVNMTNDAWFGDTSEPWEHMALAKLRSVEQRRWMVRSTNSGISGFVDPVGRLTKQTPLFKEATLIEDVAWLDLWTPYRVIGNKPYWLASFLILCMSWLKKRRLLGIFSKR